AASRRRAGAAAPERAARPDSPPSSLAVRGFRPGPSRQRPKCCPRPGQYRATAAREPRRAVAPLLVASGPGKDGKPRRFENAVMVSVEEGEAAAEWAARSYDDSLVGVIGGWHCHPVREHRPSEADRESALVALDLLRERHEWRAPSQWLDVICTPIRSTAGGRRVPALGRPIGEGTALLSRSLPGSRWHEREEQARRSHSDRRRSKGDLH